MTDRPPEWWSARQAAERLGLTGGLRQVATELDTTFMLIIRSGVRYAIRVSSSPISTHDALATECRWIERLAGSDLSRVHNIWVRSRFTRSYARRLGAARAWLHVDARSHDDDPSTVRDWPSRLCGIGDLAVIEAVAGPGRSASSRTSRLRSRRRAPRSGPTRAGW